MALHSSEREACTGLEIDGQLSAAFNCCDLLSADIRLVDRMPDPCDLQRWFGQRDLIPDYHYRLRAETPFFHQADGPDEPAQLGTAVGFSGISLHQRKIRSVFPKRYRTCSQRAVIQICRHFRRAREFLAAVGFAGHIKVERLIRVPHQDTAVRNGPGKVVGIML